jgi:uncharacterized protein YjbJ (UPF0337 family)
MNRDELQGKGKVLKGQIKQVAGDLTHNRELHNEGVADEVAGHAQDVVGHIRRNIGEAVKNAGNAIKK